MGEYIQYLLYDQLIINASSYGKVNNVVILITQE